MSTPKDIAQLFINARKKQGWSIEDVCNKSRIHPKVLKNIEAGIFDKLGPLYMKSFLKKYAGVLEMNVDEVIRRYEMLSVKEPAPVFNPTSDLPKETVKKVKKESMKVKDDVMLALQRKNIQTILTVVFSGVFVLLTFVFLGMLRSRIVSNFPKNDVKIESKKVKSQKSKADTKAQTVKIRSRKEKIKIEKKGTDVKKQKSEVKKTAVVPVMPPARLVLTLTANDKAWIQLTAGEKTIFSGILESGTSKTWRSDSDLTVWTGKAEKLEFTVNGNDLGKVADGVVKNITVSPEGVKIGKKWISHIE